MVTERGDTRHVSPPTTSNHTRRTLENQSDYCVVIWMGSIVRRLVPNSYD